MSDFHFLRPEAIFLILPLAFLFFYNQIKPLKAGNWQNVISPALQKYVLIQQAEQKNNRILNIALWVGALLAIIALAGPSWEKQKSTIYRSSQGIVIGLDLSLSMTSQDVSPSRLQRAKYKIVDALEMAKDQYLGLIAYAGDAHVASPLTQDIATLKTMLPALDPYIMPKAGSYLVSLAKETASLFKQSNVQSRTLFLVADGVEAKDIDEAAAILNDANIQLRILAVGTEQGAPMAQPDGRFIKDSKGQVILPPLEWDNLQALADQTNAKIERLSNNDDDLKYLLSDLTNHINYEKQDNDDTFDNWLDSGYWLLLPILLIALGAFRKGIVLLIPLTLILQTDHAWASTLPDALLNADQQGEKYFNENPEQAAQLFKDPKWKASSLYKAGDYEGALNIWQQYKDPQSLYNQGNALAQLQRFDEAIFAYERALNKNPDLQDAKDNKALIEQLLQNQPQDSQSNQQQNQQNADQQKGQNQQGQGQQNQQNSQDQSKQQDSYNQSNQNKAQDSNEPNSESEETSEQPDSQEGNSDKYENPLETAQTEAEKQKEEELKERRKQNNNESSENTDDQQQQTQQQQAGQKQGDTQLENRKDLEQQQAVQQWMERIPDDPGGLLRNKFMYQYQQRQRQQPEQSEERKPW